MIETEYSDYAALLILLMYLIIWTLLTYGIKRKPKGYNNSNKIK